MVKIKKLNFFIILLAAPSLVAAQQTASPGLSASNDIGTTGYKVEVKIKGLGSSDAVQLTNNGVDALNVTSNGKYTFKPLYSNGAKYSVVPATSYSPDISCTAANPAGVISGADVLVQVSCTPNIESGAIQSVNGSQAGAQVDNNGANNSAALSAGGSNGSAPSLSNGADNSPDLSLPGQGQQSQSAGNPNAPTLDNSGDMANGGGDLTIPSASSAQKKGAAGANQIPNQQSVKQQAQQAPTISLTKDETSPFTLLNKVPLRSGTETPPILFKLSPNVITVDPPKKGLPQGLKLSRNKNMEEITGTPATTSPKAPYTITVYNKGNESASITIDILVEDRPTIKLEPGQALPFLLSAGIALSKTEKYNKPIYFKISAHVASIVPTPALPTGLKFSINGKSKTAEIIGTPSYAPDTWYSLVAYDKNKGESNRIHVQISVAGCGDQAVQHISTYGTYTDLAKNGDAPDATPYIQTCIKNVQNYDAANKVKGGRVVFRLGAYVLKTQLDLTPNGSSISSFTFKTQGVGLANALPCKPPFSTSYNNGDRVLEYGNNDNGPDCAIFLAAPNFLGGKQPAPSSIGAWVYSSQVIYHSQFDHLIFDGNHQFRTSGTLYTDCVNQAPARGYNTSIQGYESIYSHIQAMHGLCGNSFMGGNGGGAADTYTHMFVGHDGSNGNKFWDDGLTAGAGSLVEYSTIEDNTDVDFFMGYINTSCDDKPDTEPGVATHNIIIQGYSQGSQHDTQTATGGLLFFRWPGKTGGNFRNSCGRVTAEDNCVEGHGSNFTVYGSFLEDSQGPDSGGAATDNEVCASGGIHDNGTYLNSGNGTNCSLLCVPSKVGQEAR